MKKILISGMTDTVGGMECFIMNYYRRCQSPELKFDFLVNFPTMAFEEEVKKNGSNVFHITSRSRHYWKNRQELKYFFDNYASLYDAIWLQQCDLTNIDILKLAYKYGIPRRIMHSHNTADMHKRFIRPLTSFLHKIHKKQLSLFATDFWACSQDAGLFFYEQSIRKSNDYRIIPNAINVSDFKYNPTIRFSYRKCLGVEKNFVLGFVGRLHEQKNPLFLLEIFLEVQKVVPHAILLIIGTGRLREAMENKAKQLGITQSVRFLGVRSDISQIMQAMDVFVLPSIFEGLPVVSIEAQAADLPCIVSEAIPESAKITEHMLRLPLSVGVHIWAKRLLIFYKKNERHDRSVDMAEAGYDISVTSKKLKSIFLEKNGAIDEK